MNRPGGERNNGQAVRIEIKGKGPFIAKVITPELEAAEAKGATLSAKFLTSGTEILDQLDQEVAEMPIASRFSPTRQLKENMYRGHRTTHEDATERDAKRMQLESNLKSIRYAYKILASRLAGIVEDIEATKLEG